MLSCALIISCPRSKAFVSSYWVAIAEAPAQRIDNCCRLKKSDILRKLKKNLCPCAHLVSPPDTKLFIWQTRANHSFLHVPRQNVLTAFLGSLACVGMCVTTDNAVPVLCLNRYKLKVCCVAVAAAVVIAATAQLYVSLLLQQDGYALGANSH